MDNLKKVFLITILLSIFAIFVYIYKSSSIIVSSRVFYLSVIRQIVFLSILAFFAKELMMNRVHNAILFIVVALPILARTSLSIPVYVDQLGYPTNLGITAITILLCFTMLLFKQTRNVRSLFHTIEIKAMLVLLACGIYTQYWHLGYHGILIVFVRIGLPLMFILLIATCCERGEKQTKQLLIIYILSILIAILMRITTTITLERAQAIGSWTIYGTTVAGMVPLILGLCLSAKSKVARIVLLVLAVLFVFETFASQTRGAVVGLISCLVFIFHKKARLAIIVITAITILLISFKAISISNIFEYKFSGNRRIVLDYETMIESPNVQTRIERNMDGIKYILAHPILGLGLGKPTPETGSQLPVWVYNPYLAWAVPMGVLAGLSFLVLMIAVTVHAIKNVRNAGNNNALDLGIIGVLVTWIVNQFTTGDSLTYIQSIESTLYFYAIIGIIIGRYMSKSDINTGEISLCEVS